MKTAKFWWETLDRAIKTGAQDIIKVFGAAEILSLAGVNWGEILGFAGVGVALSILTSIVSAPFGEEDSPTLLGPGLPTV